MTVDLESALFGISGVELFIIVVFALLIFGPERLPEMGRTIGRAMREFKRAQDSMEAVIRAEVYGKDRETSLVPESRTPHSTKRRLDDDDDEEEEEE